MKKITLTCSILLLVMLALNNKAIHGLMSWLNTPVTTKAEIIGKDGALIVSDPNTIINKYAVLAADSPAGASVITITNPGGSHGLSPSTLSPGDLLLIVQMAGASIDTTDTPNYGALTSLNNAGRHEFVTVNNVNDNVITVNPPCGGLRYSYTASGKVQVIRVPLYTSLTINNGASLIAPVWDGFIGGIVAIHVQNNAIINGAVDVSGLGLRGGVLSAAGGGGFRADYRTTQQDFGAEKGEGIAGYQMDYDFMGGRYGRGAAANAGGGGTAHNSGGGGGANGHNGSAYNGQGIMDPAPAISAAWAQDPGYIANGNSLTNSSGGGRGGYSFSVNDANAMSTPPGDPAWGGDYRRNVGGIGGHPVVQDTSGRIFLGGGGGAGAQNNDAGGAGGNGGGLIYIIANNVNGSGVLRANGTHGGDTRNEHRDGAGGGGAGGTIVVSARTLSGISAVADGGKGGNQSIPPINDFPNHSLGPGGGGGGGYIAYATGNIFTSVKGGPNGRTQVAALSEFPNNGATSGATGATIDVVANIPFCQTTTDLSITKTNSSNTIIPGAPTTYAIVATNNGPNPVFGVSVTDIVPPIFGNISWTCTASTGSRCFAASGTGNIDTKVDLTSAGNATFLLTATADPAATGSVTNTARVEMPNGATDTNPNNNTASDTDTLTPHADLSITKTNGANIVTPGLSTTYNIVVRNNGPSTVVGAVVNDPLPTQLSNASWTCVASTGSSCGAAAGQGNINTTVNLAPGGTARFILTALVSSTATGMITNTASVGSPGGTTDPNPNNNSSSTNTSSQPSSDLRIIKTASRSTIRAGDDLTYNLNVTNLGPSSAADVVVTDALQSGLVLSSAVPSQGSCAGTSTIRCSLGSLAATTPNNVATVMITVRVPLNFPQGQLVNTGVIESPTPDPVPGNNSSTVTVSVSAAPRAAFRIGDVNIKNSISDICIGGSTFVNVEVKLTNTGDGIQRDNPGPEFIAQLPLQLSTSGPCTASNGNCLTAPRQVQWDGTVAPGQTVTINYRVQVRFDTEPGTRFCTDYIINYDTNSDGANDSSMALNNCMVANCTPPPCSGPDCPNTTPGDPYPGTPNSLSSDQRPGSILIFPYYTSDATGATQHDTRFSITNTDSFLPAYLHMFFVDGNSCSVADNFICLTPSQTVSFLASDLDPGVPGYLIVIAVDKNGCPTNFNRLIGESYIKQPPGFVANLGAVAVPAIDVTACDISETFTTINLDGKQYNRLGRVLAFDNIPSVTDGNTTMVVLNSIGGNLGETARNIGPLFGLLFDDQETGFSFSLNPAVCQLRATFGASFPRSAPRFTEVIPSGHSGWIKLGLQNEGAMVGVMLNASSNTSGYRGGHNLHMLTLGNTNLTIPIIAPPCQ